jgi:clan AA aspartic protease (TIGR02281 family)
MKCARCGIENISDVDYCTGCGAPLRFIRTAEPFQKRKIVIIAAVIIIWGASFAFFFKDVLFSGKIFSESGMNNQTQPLSSQDGTRENLFANLKALKEAEQFLPDVGGEGQGREDGNVTGVLPSAASEEGREVVSGALTIYDSFNREVSHIRAALLGNGWLATPARACLGGTIWSFLADSGEKTLVQGGSWNEGAPVGVWQVDKVIGSEKNVGLAVWDGTIPVTWFSLESENGAAQVALSSFHSQGNFTTASWAPSFQEVGIFVQGVDVVGWTFGQWLPGAYLWTPSRRDVGGPSQEISVEDFYNITFAGGREEKFNIALAAENDADPVSSILLFLEGFRLPPKLSVLDTPYYLLPSEIIKQLRSLTKKAVAGGSEKQVVEIFDNRQTLKLIGDMVLFMDLVQPVARVHGYEAAIALIEDTGSSIVQKMGVNVPELNKIHLSFYQGWLQNLVTNGAIEKGDSVYLTARKYYANDPYIHLLGTELELLKGKWMEAEELLYQREYPPELMDRFELLARQISDLKSLTGNIVIRFHPGATRIPVTALLNSSRSQDFLVDTGASFVTIPTSSAAELGLNAVPGERYKHRRVSTPGGVLLAREVILESLEIDGWVEYGVTALVVDIPDQPRLGLLGLNYLSRFSMDLNSDAGVLSLSPR